jgi:hypothetical protein
MFLWHFYCFQLITNTEILLQFVDLGGHSVSTIHILHGFLFFLLINCSKRHCKSKAKLVNGPLSIHSQHISQDFCKHMNCCSSWHTPCMTAWSEILCMYKMESPYCGMLPLVTTCQLGIKIILKSQDASCINYQITWIQRDQNWCFIRPNNIAVVLATVPLKWTWIKLHLVYHYFT